MNVKLHSEGFYWVIAALVMLFLPIRWAFDRDPPFRLNAAYISPTQVKAGTDLRLDMPAARDTDRNCSVRFSRYLIDSRGARTDLFDKPSISDLGRPQASEPRIGTVQGFMSAEGIDAMSRAMGPSLKVVVPIAQSMPPGLGYYGVDLEYQCNPLHAIWPIHVSLRIPFDVLAP